jgi:hypothetical protein
MARPIPRPRAATPARAAANPDPSTPGLGTSLVAAAETPARLPGSIRTRRTQPSNTNDTSVEQDNPAENTDGSSEGGDSEGGDSEGDDSEGDSDMIPTRMHLDTAEGSGSEGGEQSLEQDNSVDSSSDQSNSNDTDQDQDASAESSAEGGDSNS